MQAFSRWYKADFARPCSTRVTRINLLLSAALSATILPPHGVYFVKSHVRALSEAGPA